MEHSPKFKPLLSQSSSRRRRTSTDSNSPEFEFWRNPTCPQPNLLSADELFVDGVLLPLHLLPPPLPNNSDPPDPYPRFSDPNTQPISQPPVPDPEPLLEPDPESEPGPGPELSAAPVLTASKRWRDIFKKGEKKSVKGDEIDKDKDKKKERKGGRSGASSAELNINIWPFSRSRSAGNAYTRPKPFGAQATRKVNSAPCSRSNSTGDSKSRKWPPASPGRPGVHLGRSSPVWQVRRGASAAAKSNSEPQARNAEKGTKQEVPEIRRSKKTAGSVVAGGRGSKARVLNLNAPICMGYRSHLSCRSENSAVGVGVGGGSSSINLRGGVSGGVNGGGGNGVGGNVGAGGSFEHRCHSSASEIQVPKCVRNPNAVLVGLAAALTAFGTQMYADSAKFYALVEIVKRRESRLQATDRMLAHALHDSYLDSKDIDISKPALCFIPSAVEGQKVSIKFQIPATRDVAQLIANIASDLGLIIESGGGGLHAHCNYFFPSRCRVYWQTMLARPDKMKETGGEGGGLRIQVFRSVIPFSDRFEIEFVKDGVWSLKEVDVLVSTFTSQLAGGKIEPAEHQI